LDYTKSHSLSELDVPVDVDQFCNEIIEEGIAAQNVAHGCGQAGAAEQKFPAAVGRPIAGPEGGQPTEGPGPAERPHQRNQVISQKSICFFNRYISSFRTTSDSAAAHEEAVAIVPQLPKPL